MHLAATQSSSCSRSRAHSVIWGGSLDSKAKTKRNTSRTSSAECCMRSVRSLAAAGDVASSLHETTVREPESSRCCSRVSCSSARYTDSSAQPHMQSVRCFRDNTAETRSAYQKVIGLSKHVVLTDEDGKMRIQSFPPRRDTEVTPAAAVSTAAAGRHTMPPWLRHTLGNVAGADG